VLGEDKVSCLSAWDFPAWSRNVNDDKALVKEFADVLREADGIITHNGIRFDWKFLQTRLMINGLKPLPKIPHIDTCSLARSNLYFLNNKLKTLASFLTDEQKKITGGWELWEKVWRRDKTSMRKMVDYCKQDVRALEELFLKLRPFATNLPNAALWSGTSARETCASCGSRELRSEGVRATKTRRYRRLACLDCGSWTKGEILE